MRILFTLFFVAIFAVSASAEDQFIVQKTPLDPQLMFWNLSITSKDDPLIISHVDVNRGCQPRSMPQIPLTLPFGRQAFLGTYACEPIEVTIETSKGDQTISWGHDDEDKGLVAQKYNIPIPPMSPEFANFPPEDNWSLIITNIDKQLIVSSVTVNKGHCQFARRLTMPENQNNGMRLNFGDRYAVALANCNPISVIVVTNRGTMDFNWDN